MKKRPTGFGSVSNKSLIFSIRAQKLGAQTHVE